MGLASTVERQNGRPLTLGQRSFSLHDFTSNLRETLWEPESWAWESRRSRHFFTSRTAGAGSTDSTRSIMTPIHL